MRSMSAMPPQQQAGGAGAVYQQVGVGGQPAMMQPVVAGAGGQIVYASAPGQAMMQQTVLGPNGVPMMVYAQQQPMQMGSAPPSYVVASQQLAVNVTPAGQSLPPNYEEGPPAFSP